MAPIPDAQLLDAIRTIADRTEGYVTFQAVADELGLVKSGVHRRVHRLAELGLLEIVPGRSGGIRLAVSAGS